MAEWLDFSIHPNILCTVLLLTVDSLGCNRMLQQWEVHRVGRVNFAYVQVSGGIPEVSWFFTAMFYNPSPFSSSRDLSIFRPRPGASNRAFSTTTLFIFYVKASELITLLPTSSVTIYHESNDKAYM